MPGLAAKPIADFVVGIDDPHDEPAFVPDLAAAGYDLRVREPQHRCFRIGDPTSPSTCTATRPNTRRAASS